MVYFILSLTILYGLLSLQFVQDKISFCEKLAVTQEPKVIYVKIEIQRKSCHDPGIA